MFGSLRTADAAISETWVEPLLAERHGHRHRRKHDRRGSPFTFPGRAFPLGAPSILFPICRERALCYRCRLWDLRSGAEGLGYTASHVYHLGVAMQVAKWGNSLAVRLPANVVEALELREGDDIEIVVDAPRLFAVRKKPGRGGHAGAASHLPRQAAGGLQVQPG